MTKRASKTRCRCWGPFSRRFIIYDVDSGGVCGVGKDGRRFYLLLRYTRLLGSSALFPCAGYRSFGSILMAASTNTQLTAYYFARAPLRRRHQKGKCAVSGKSPRASYLVESLDLSVDTRPRWPCSMVYLRSGTSASSGL